MRTLDGTLAGQLVDHEQKVLVARGGRGGRGNEQFKSERNNAPKLMEKGEPGAERWLQIELKLVGGWVDGSFVWRMTGVFVQSTHSTHPPTLSPRWLT